MRDNSVVSSVLAIVGTAVVIVACGSDPKPDVTAPSTPSATPAVTTPSVDAGDPSAAAAAGADAGGGKTDKQADCDHLVDDANSTLDAARIAVDKVCKKDADCMGVKGRACGFNCVTGAIPKAEEKDWNAAVDKVKGDACKKWDTNECSKLKTKPPPTCQDRKVWCDKGHCALKEAASK